MQQHEKFQKFEGLIHSLREEAFLEEYKSKRDNYKTSLLPKIFGTILVWCGNFVYGKEPSYLKFRAVEVIARVPYQSWSSASYTLMTMFYSDQKKALELGRTTKFARLANDNETMHVVVVSALVKETHKQPGFIMHTIIPMIFAFFYFWVSYILFLVKKEWSYELNYLFESHAFMQYSSFLKKYGHTMKDKVIENEFLKWYGRTPASHYEFFLDVRSDELVHRNTSIDKIEEMTEKERSFNWWPIFIVFIFFYTLIYLF